MNTVIAQPRNLAELKRSCPEGARVEITNNFRPQASRITVVTKGSTVDLITRARNDGGLVVEQSHLAWGKAADWTFTDDGAIRHDRHVGPRGERLPGDPDPRWDLTIKVLGDEPGNPRLPDLSDSAKLAGHRWALVDGEGNQFAVGPFKDEADADHFRALMFGDPDHGDSIPVGSIPDGIEQVSVSGFQAALRASFTRQPAPHWGAH